MWFSATMLDDYRLPFLQDVSLLTKLTRLYELRSMYAIVVNSVLDGSPVSFLGGKPILCHMISSYLIGDIQ